MTKRSALIIGLTIIAVGVIIYGSKKYTREQTFLTAETIESQRQALAVDTDNDGLKDWEEELWKTDKASADSDSDGTTDTEEIRSGRNPVIPGPNDTLDQETITTKVNPEIEADLSRTDKFSRELFAKYAAGYGKTELIGDDYFNIFYKNLQQELESSPPTYFSANDLSVIYTDNPSLYKTYGNAVGAIFTKREGAPALEHELDILQRASEGNTDELQKLTPLVTEYTRIQNELAKIDVPDDLLISHLTLLNSVAGVLEGIKGMQIIVSDSVKAAAQMQRYPESVDGLSSSLKSIATFMREKGIRFSTSEKGVIFSNL